MTTTAIKADVEAAKARLQAGAIYAAAETPSSHTPLRTATGATAPEVWVHTHVEFEYNHIQGTLQPGQCVPVYSRTAVGQPFQLVAGVQITTRSAYVYGKRYMVMGGGEDYNTHPTIDQWNSGTPLLGKAALLRYPGGIVRTRLSPGTPFIGTTEAADRDKNRMLADKANTMFGKCVLETCSHSSTNSTPLALVVSPEAELPGTTPTAMACISGREGVMSVLPLPQILSGLAQDVLSADGASGDESMTWLSGIMEYLDLCDVLDISLAYIAPGDASASCSPADTMVPIIHRAALQPGDLGIAMLDPDLQLRLLPFSNGRCELDMM